MTRTPDEKPKGGLQPLEVDRPYPASHLGIMRVSYAALSRSKMASRYQMLQGVVKASGGEAIPRAFSRAESTDREFWAVWEDSETGTFYFVSDDPWGLDIPFELPDGWFKPEGRVLKWRTEEEEGERSLYVLRHRATTPTRNGEEVKAEQ